MSFRQYIPPTPQLTMGMGSLTTGIALALPTSQPVLDVFYHVFGLYEVGDLFALAMMGAGLVLLLIRMPLLWYRVMVTPFVLFCLFLIWQMMVLGIVWLPLITLIVTLVGLVSVSRRANGSRAG